MVFRKLALGHTLLETMVVMAVCLAMLSTGAPALGGWINSSRVQTGIQALATSLSLARSEAIKRNARVVVCKSSTGKSCETAIGWEQGWIVFHDENNNAIVDSGEQLLLREHGLPDALRLSGNAQLSHYVSYTPYGRTKTVAGAFQAGTFTVCAGDGRGLRGSQVVINSNGRARVVREAGGACA